MQTNYTKRFTEVIAVAPDGMTYVIQRRCKALAGDDDQHAYFYCCLPDGQIVSWLGPNQYQLSDGTTLVAVAGRQTSSAGR
ncbi:hypothetical protein D3C86_1686110 [compost metagenome]